MTPKPSRFAGVIAAVLFSASVFHAEAQTPPAATDNDSDAEDTIVLSPFMVTAADDDGYVANSSLSATRLATKIKDLPFNVQVVTEELLRDLGRDSIEESLTQVSNVTLSERNREAGPDSALVGLRGFRSGVILRNGVKGFYPDSMADVQRVEVIKGPTALYGVADPGGVINYITKMPTEQTRSQVQAQFGSYGRYGVTLDHNQPLDGKKKVLFRIVASHDYWEDIQPFVNFERTYVEPMVTVRPTQTTTVHATYSYSHRTGIPIRNPSPFQVSATGPVYQVGFVDVPREFTTANPTDTFSRDTEVIESWIEQRLSGDWVARLSYTYMDFNSEFYGTWTGNAARAAVPPYFLPRNAVVEFHEAELYSTNLSVTGRFRIGPTQHTILLGGQTDGADRLDYNKQIRPSDPLGLANVNITNPSPDTAVQHFNRTRDQILSGVGLNGGSRAWRESGSDVYYLTDEMHAMDDKLILLAAVRHVKIDTPKTKKTSPQLGATWHATGGVSLYGGYSEGLRDNNGVDEEGNQFDPEKSKAWEIGLKVDLSEKLSGTIAAFHIERENIIVQDGSAAVWNAQNPTQPPRPLRYLGGTQEADGFEADLIFTPTPGWQAIFSYGYQDARTTESPLQRLPTDPAADANGLVDIVGLPNEGSAKNNVGLWTRYKFEEGPMQGLTVGGGGFWKQGPIYLFPTYQNRFVRQEDDVFELNFFARYSTKKLFGETTTFSLNVTNVTDEIYWAARGLYAQPRKALFSMSVVF